MCVSVCRCVCVCVCVCVCMRAFMYVGMYCNMVDNKLIIVGCPSCSSILTYCIDSDMCGP